MLHPTVAVLDVVKSVLGGSVVTGTMETPIAACPSDDVADVADGALVGLAVSIVVTPSIIVAEV